MTADDTPQTLLRAVRDHAWDYIVKPFPPATITDVVRKALAADGSLAIEVLSARPEWVELLVPCSLEVADRLQGFMMRLDADLPDDLRESVGYAFRELLCNAIEWGGRLDVNRKVRIAYLRAKRMLVYRIADPGEGFKMDDLAHSADQQCPRPAARPCGRPRGDGHSGGRLRHLPRARHGRRTALQRSAQRGGVRKIS